MSTRSLKKAVQEPLAEHDLDRVVGLALANRKVFNILVSLAMDKNELICWRAIEAVGVAAAAVTEEDSTIVRNFVRQLIWSVREESGAMGWSALEMLGEIVRNSPRAFSDIPPIIISLHEEDEEGVFLKGALWAAARMAEAGITGEAGTGEMIEKGLSHSDPSARGLAVWAASRLGYLDAGRMEALTGDKAGFVIYEDGELVKRSVGEMARSALASGI